MSFLLRFALPLVVLLGVMPFALSPVVVNLIAHWFQRDVEMRSELVYNSVHDSLAVLARAGSRREIGGLFRRIAEDERVLAVGWCDPERKLRQASPTWPKGVACPLEPVASQKWYGSGRAENGPLLVAAFPLALEAEDLGWLVILNDVSFIERRSGEARWYLAGFLALVGGAVAGVTVLVAHLTLRHWISSVRQSLKGIHSEGPPRAGTREIAPVIREIRQMLRDLEISRRAAAGIRIDWSPDTLRRVLDAELPGSQVLVVSNREPYIHNQEDGAVVLQRPASGIVTALEPIMRACRGTWIAHGSGTADRTTVDKYDRVAVPPDQPSYTLRRVWLSDEEQEGYYYGLANEGLWPLCHLTFVRPVFRESDWAHYVAVNRKFAEAVVAEAKGPNPVVLVQDYHFTMLPRMIRQQLPHATIIAFWHIPWPNPEVFGICPWRQEVLDGLLGSSIIGFHTQFHCNNFIETADRFVECHLDREQSTISVGGHTTLVRPYPISIEWPPAPLKSQAPVADCRAAVRKRMNLPADTLLGVGVERFDFSKGIPDRFRAVERLLETHPEWIGRFVFLQAAAPTRSKLPAYQSIQAETAAVAQQVNDRFGRDGYTPILLVPRHHEPEQVYELFRAADICIVSSLHDGMNLVAKEFVAARDDRQGVLILSTFAGASRELMEALIVNPYDARAMGEAIQLALTMPADQQRERMSLMRERISEDNIFYWAGRMLLDAARLRKLERIESSIAAASARESARA